MNKNIKLYKFIIVGHLVINLPTILICFGLPIILGLLIENILFKIIAIVLGFIIGITISWLLWSYLITKWRLWAFNRVEENDMLQLKELAITYKLIWDDESGFEQTEIRTKSEKKRIHLIAENIHFLEQIEEINTDLKTPSIYGYKLSKKEIIIESFSIILVLIIAIGTFFTTIYFLGIIIILILIMNIKNIKYLQKLLVDRNYLELSNEGIRIGFSDEDFIEWGRVNHLSIDREQRMLILEMGSNKNATHINFELWRLDSYDYNEFNKVIKVFIERYKLRHI